MLSRQPDLRDIVRLASDFAMSKEAMARAYIDAQRRLDANSPQIQQVKLQIAQAKLQTETDKANYLRHENLVKTQAVSQVSYEKAKLQYESSKRNEEILEKSLHP